MSSVRAGFFSSAPNINPIISLCLYKSPSSLYRLSWLNEVRTVLSDWPTWDFIVWESYPPENRHLNVKKLTIFPNWQFFGKKDKFWHLKKCLSFCQFFDIQMAIFRRVSCEWGQIRTCIIISHEWLSTFCWHVWLLFVYFHHPTRFLNIRHKTASKHSMWDFQTPAVTKYRPLNQNTPSCIE